MSIKPAILSRVNQVCVRFFYSLSLRSHCMPFLVRWPLQCIERMKRRLETIIMYTVWWSYLTLKVNYELSPNIDEPKLTALLKLTIDMIEWYNLAELIVNTSVYFGRWTCEQHKNFKFKQLFQLTNNHYQIQNSSIYPEFFFKSPTLATKSHPIKCIGCMFFV